MTDRSRTNDIDRLSEAMRSLQKSLECTICLKLMTEPTKTRCGHSFCKSCIGTVLQRKSTSCPLCRKNLNRRNISKDDHLQTCIEKFKRLVAAIQIDSNVDILSHLKQPCDTKESCSYPDARQSDQNSNKGKLFKKERYTHQSNQSVNRQADVPSTSRGTVIGHDYPRYNDSNAVDEKPEILSSLFRVQAFPNDENDNAIHSTSDIKVRTWLHTLSDDLPVANERQPIEGKARPIDPISDDNRKSYETGEVHRDGIDACRRPSQGRKRSTNRPERIDENDALSQVNKEARQIGEVIEIDSAMSGLKYKACHAKVRAKNQKTARATSDSEEIVNQSSSSSTAANDQVHQIAMSTPPSLNAPGTSAIAEQSTANWSRVIEFGKEMKGARRRKVKKLNVSTEKNKNPPRIIENIRLTPNSRYDSARIVASHNTSEKEANISNRLEESKHRKPDAIDKSLDLSDAEAKASNETITRAELFGKTKADSSSSTHPEMKVSYFPLEKGRKLRIINLNNDQVNKIIGLENATKDAQLSQDRCSEENAEIVVNYHDSLLTLRERLTILTPEKLNESVHEREIIRDVSQTSAGNFGSSSGLPVEKRTPGPRETSDIQGTSSRAVSSQLQFPTPNKSRLSLRRKPGTDDNKDADSPPLSQLPLSDRLSIGKHEEDISDRKSVNSPIPKGVELSDRLKAVRRDLSFKIIREDQQRIGTVSVSACLKSTIENNGGNVSGIIRQNEKLDRNFTGESTVSKKFLSRKSRSVESQKRRSPVKFMQLGTLIRRRNIKYFFLGSTKRERSMSAEVRVASVYNMQQLISKSEVHTTTSPNPSNDSQSSCNSTVVENIRFANNSNANQAVSKELSMASPICNAPAISTPERDIDPHLNRKKSAAIVRSSADANQRFASDKSIENVARSLHKTPRADRSAIHETISHTHPGTSNSIKLLSPNKDSQLKFLEIDSPMSEHEDLRCASSTKSAIKENNFSEMETSRLAASMPGKAREPFIESPNKKRKRMRCADDRELFEDGSSDGNDDSNDSVNTRITIKFDRYSGSSKKAGSDRNLDANKKRRLSSPDDQDVVEIIPSVSKEQETRGRKFKTIMLSSDEESESATHITKNLKRHSGDQHDQRNTSITNMATKECLARQNSDEDFRTRNIIDKWISEHDATRKKLTKESKNSQSSAKSIRCSPEENPASHRSSHSTNTLETEKRKNAKSSQKSFARESDMFGSSSLFNSENMDYILQQSTRLNAGDTSKKIVDPSNDDIINRVLQIDRSRSNPDACQPPGSVSRNGVVSQREKDSKEYLLHDNFDEIIASVEQPQSEDVIPCTEQPGRNPNRPLAEQKTSNCPAMTDKLYETIQETLIMPASSTNDMFEHHSPRNVRKTSMTKAISRNVGKDNVTCSQEKHGYMDDQRNRKDATANANAIDKDSHKKTVSKHNVSQGKEKFLEERNALIQSVSRLRVSETQRATAAGNESNLRDDTFEHDSLMNITQHQAQLQMFEEDLFGIADTRNQTKTSKVTSQNDSSQEEQRTPRKRKQNIQNKNATPGGRSVDEDDIVENTPEKKMKNSGNNVKTTDSRESIQIAFLSPISKAAERTPNASGQMVGPFRRSDASTPMNLFGMCPSSQSTPIIAHNFTTINRPDIFEGSKRTERIESGSILLAKQVDAKTLDNVRQQPDMRDLCFVCSGLSAVQTATVKEFAAKYNAKYVNQFDRDVTHVIMKTTGEQNAAESTLKYLQGIAHRKWIVSYRWIEECIREKKLLDEISYEATTMQSDGVNGAGPRNSRLRDRGLFEGFTFLCVKPYNNVSLNQYQDLLLATGATVVDSLEVLAKMEGMKGVVIEDNVHDDKLIEYWYRTAKAAPILVDWIVECIGRYKLFKLAPYIQCLSPQDFCTIGYPRELVEEDEEYSDDE